MDLESYFLLDFGALRFLKPFGDASVTLRPEEVSAYPDLYAGLAIRLAGAIRLMGPEVDRWEGLALIILDFRQFGFFNTNLTVEETGALAIQRLARLSHGEPLDETVTEIIISHALMARAEAAKRGYVGATETVQ